MKQSLLIKPLLFVGMLLIVITGCNKDDVPVLSTIIVSDITQTTAICGGNITSDGGTTVIARGVCWSTTVGPTINDRKSEDGTGAGNFTSRILGLESNTIYYVRAYATNSEGTGYGSVMSFITQENVPVLSTIEVTEINQTTAISGGNIVDEGAPAVTARGVCWSTAAEPTINDKKTEDGTGVGSFTSSLTDLNPITTYYVRAYATNSVGTGYGSSKSFTTLQGVSALVTKEVKAITSISAISGGNITDDGGIAVTKRGVCWSTTNEPTINDNKTEDGAGSGSFTSSITDLKPNTTYYVRAYATNRAVTAYGSEMSFTTQEIGASNSFTDSRDGTVYQTVTIGDQEWMAENLRYLPSIDEPSRGSNTESYYYVYGYSGRSVADAKASANYETYGVLYNGLAIMEGAASSTFNPSGVQGVCPAGWHLPSDAEWSQLENYLADNGYNYDGTTGAGGSKIGKSLASTSGWTSSSRTGAVGNTDYLEYRNKSGFTALPSGFRNRYGEFDNLLNYGGWWSATVDNSSLFYPVWTRGLRYGFVDLGRGSSNKDMGLSVRCVRN